MTLRRPTTERGHVSHAFVVHGVTPGHVRYPCVQWFKRGLALTGVHLCV
jgi:hypothetical protein